MAAKASAASARATHPAPQKKRVVSSRERERMVRAAMWTFEVEGIIVTREEAEKALERSLSKPVPNV